MAYPLWLSSALSDDSSTSSEAWRQERASNDRVATPDAELVARIRDGNVTAFEELFRRHYTDLHRFAAALVHGGDGVDDAVQDVWSAVWANRSTWNPTLPLAAYLFRAVRNRVIEYARHDQVVTRAEGRALGTGDSPGMGVAAESPDATAVRRDLEVRLAREIRQLPERQRTVILLRWHYDMSAADMARVLNVSGPAVRKLLQKAESKLRTALGL